MAPRSESNKTYAGECTCTGGPYPHGPKGREKVLAQIAKDKKSKQEGTEK